MSAHALQHFLRHLSNKIREKDREAKRLLREEQHKKHLLQRSREHLRLLKLFHKSLHNPRLRHGIIAAAGAEKRYHSLLKRSVEAHERVQAGSLTLKKHFINARRLAGTLARQR